MKLLTMALLICLLVISFVQYGCRYDKPAIVTPVVCDTTNITFSGKVQPTLATNCLLSGCHLGNNPPNGVFLDTYTHVKAQLVLVNGTPLLLGVIKHLSGFTPMPKDKAMLDACDITKIEMWIAKGAINN